jgi:hypothetical protein
MEFELDTIVPEAAANPLRRAPPAARHSAEDRSTYSWSGASPRDEALSPVSEASPSVYLSSRTPSKPCLRDSTRGSTAASSVGAAGVESPSDGSRRASFSGVGREGRLLSTGDAHATRRSWQVLQFAVVIESARSDVSAGSGFEAVAPQEASSCSLTTAVRVVTPAVDRSVELNRAVHAKFKANLMPAEL